MLILKVERALYKKKRLRFVCERIGVILINRFGIPYKLAGYNI